jgi:hypothetical protein
MFFVLIGVSIVAAMAAHYCDRRAQAFRAPGIPAERYRLVPQRLFDDDLYMGEGEAWRKRALAAMGLMVGSFLVAFLLAVFVAEPIGP